jgi:tetratricopeptide (TPR) repeat protein
MGRKWGRPRCLSSIFIAALFLGSGAGQAGLPLRMIVVRSSGEAAKTQERLKTGADFAVLAREISVDATAVDGGLMGNVDPANLRPELRTALEGLQPGSVSQTVKIPSGYAILKVLPASELAGLAEAERTRQFAANAERSIHFSFDISGNNEAEAALASFHKPEGWNLDLASACEMRKQSYAAIVARADALISEAKDAPDAMSARVARGQLHAYRGEMDRAVEQWEIAYARAQKDLPRALPYLDELLGIGYLHKSEIANEVYRHPGERCLFPIIPAMKYAQPADSEKSVQHLLAFLKKSPDDLEAKWLLTIAYMTLGEYPKSVPAQYLLPPAAFASAEDLGRFKDVAPAAGLNLFSMAAGVIVDDFQNNGRLDVVTSSYDMCQPMHYFRNKGDGTFEDCSSKAGLSGQLGGLNILQADYNNDGCVDILVLRGGWELPQRKSLLRNNCDGTFTDVTEKAGLAQPTSTQTAVWADINNDGLLDLYVGNEGGPNQLFLNNGDGTFKDISRGSGADISAFTKGVAAADYDNDGYVDLYASNYRGYNALFHNNHDGTFTDIAKEAGVLGTGHSFPTWFFDYDNDGWPDLFVASYNMSLDESARTYLGLPHNAGTLKLYRNLGNGAFRDVTKETGLDKVFMPMGANFGDIDNDGYLDIYLGTGDPTYGSLVPNVLLHNQTGKKFVDISASSGTGELHKGHGVAFADIDNDGDEDILTVIGGAAPGDSHAFRLFENPGHGNDWISIKLIGVKSNRSAIGARIKVTVRNEGKPPRTIYRTVGSGGSFGASPLEQHVGLGKAAEIESLEIRWPGATGAPQRVVGIAKNQAVEIKEGATEYKRLTRTPYRLGGGNR